MQINEIKNISIYELLLQIGSNPSKTNSHSAFFLSPYREENTASFKVDIKKNLWYDFGSGEGGSIIDLMLKLYPCESIGQVIDRLKNMNISASKPLRNVRSNAKSILQIDSVEEISKPALKSYVRSRCISLGIANSYLKELHYNVNDRSYYGLGFINDKGGYEIRNRYFKGSSSPKYFSFIGNNNSTEIDVYEGCFDFLSSLEYNQVKMPRNDSIILNSLIFLNDCIPILKGYNIVNSYLDNDNAGREAYNMLISWHTQLVIDQSQIIYPNHKDFNEFLC